MGTILDYLKKYGKKSFDEEPFNDVDSLILCQFAYLKLDDIVETLTEKSAWITLEQIRKIGKPDKIFADERYEKDNKALFMGMLSGKRFRFIKVNYYVTVLNVELEVQFAAITYDLGNGNLYVAYRGTDENIVGWKEDFNLAFSEPTIGQLCATKYLSKVARFCQDIPIILGGHSKGGNLAAFAAMSSSKGIQDRVQIIYSHDGPGFRKKVLERYHYDRIAPKVKKILPHSSLVGMLMEDNEKYEVVKSKTIGLMQHNPFTWCVEENDFVRVSGLYERTKFMDSTINQWIDSLSDERISFFADTLFKVIEGSEATDLISFTNDWKKSMTGVFNSLKDVDPVTKKMIKKIMKGLFEMGAIRAKEEITFLNKIFE